MLYLNTEGTYFGRYFEKNVTCMHANLTQPTASHHLGILEKEGIIKRRKEGKWVFHAIADLSVIRE